MPYTVTKTNGTIFTTVSDGTINTDSSLTLIGKDYVGYSEHIANDLIRLLESGANNVPAANPLVGQLWYDTTSKNLNVYDGLEFKTLGSLAVNGTQPAAPVTGDMWFNSTTKQLGFYDGTQYINIGPVYPAAAGKTGWEGEVVVDTLGQQHTISKLYVNTVVVAIASKDAAFTLPAAITNFDATIQPGIQLANSIVGVTPQYKGTATNSLLLNGIASTGFVSTTTNSSMQGTLSIFNDTGLTVGAAGNSRLYVDGVGQVVLSGISSNANLVLQVSVGGVATPVITCNGATGLASVQNPTSNLNIANKIYVDTADAALQANIDLKIPLSYMGAVNGVASLDASGKIITTQLPSLAITDTYVVASQTAMLALVAQQGDVAVRTDINETYILAGTDPTILANWQQLITTNVVSVGGYTGTVSALQLITAIETVDGSGSGLDADLLDGHDSTYFYSSATPPPNHALTFDASTMWTVPTGVYIIYLTGVGGGQGGEGGGDGGNTSAGPQPTAGGDSSVAGSLETIVFKGGYASMDIANGNQGSVTGSRMFKSTPSYSNINLSNIAHFNQGGQGPYATNDTGAGAHEAGGNGGDSFFAKGGAGGYGTSVTTPGDPGAIGSGGGGGSGQDGLSGAGGCSGFAGVAVPMFVTPGETLTITVGAGSAGTVGYRSTGGNGGNGRIVISY